MLLFQLPGGVAHLHVGDFRWTPSMAREPALAPYVAAACDGGQPGARIRRLYLDTTYCRPCDDFPPQEAVVAAVISLLRRCAAADPRVLVLFGAYTIGKERLYMGAAHALSERVYVDATRYRTLSAMGWPQAELDVLTTDPGEARIHVVPMHVVSSVKRLQAMLNTLTTAPTNSGGEGTAAAQSSRGRGRKMSARRPQRGGYIGTALASVQRGGRPSPALAAIEAADAAAAALIATAAAGELGETGSDGGFFAPDAASAGTVDAPVMMMAAANAAAAARAMPPLEVRRYHSFHSIVAFRPTGWVASGGPPPHGSASDRGVARGAEPLQVGGQAVAAVGHARAVLATWDDGRRRNTDASSSSESDADGEAPVLGRVAATVQAINASRQARADDSRLAGDARETRIAAIIEEPVLVSVPRMPTRNELQLIVEGERRTVSEASSVQAVIVRVSQHCRSGGARYYPAAPANVLAATHGAEPHALPGAGTSTMSEHKRRAVSRTVDAALSARPSGQPPGGVTLYSVPYSEHSSFAELRACVAALSPATVIPTVNCRSAADADELVTLLRHH